MKFGDELRQKSAKGGDTLLETIEKMCRDVLKRGRDACRNRADRGDTSHRWGFRPGAYGLEYQDALLIQAMFRKLGKEEGVRISAGIDSQDENDWYIEVDWSKGEEQ